MKIKDILKICSRLFAAFLLFQAIFELLNLIWAAIDGSVIRDLGVTWFIYSCAISPLIKLVFGCLLLKFQDKIISTITIGIADANVEVSRTSALIVTITLFGLITASSAVPRFASDFGKFMEWNSLSAQGNTSITSSTAAFGGISGNPKFASIYDAIDFFVGVILLINSSKIAAFITAKIRSTNN